MFISPLAGALSDRIGRRPIMVLGLTLQATGFIWVAARGTLSTSWVELTVALLISGIGISMALPTVPTAVLSAVSPEHMGKAAGINYMAQRFGVVFAIAIASAAFSANGHLGTPASVIAGFRPALWACAAFAVLAALTAFGISPRRTSDRPRRGGRAAGRGLSQPRNRARRSFRGGAGEGITRRQVQRLAQQRGEGCSGRGSRDP